MFSLYNPLVSKNFFHQQKLDAGEDPITAFVLSSEAALAGAESTKEMQAQVI